MNRKVKRVCNVLRKKHGYRCRSVQCQSHKDSIEFEIVPGGLAGLVNPPVVIEVSGLDLVKHNWRDLPALIADRMRAA